MPRLGARVAQPWAEGGEGGEKARGCRDHLHVLSFSPGRAVTLCRGRGDFPNRQSSADVCGLVLALDGQPGMRLPLRLTKYIHPSTEGPPLELRNQDPTFQRGAPAVSGKFKGSQMSICRTVLRCG